ncbi:uncharacterized protein [Mobula birostris]|uniref:uncharacterized protein isoform X3 n=1 Tax=Mobula birostris TaxID=1983395 RepID=UPI003B28574E
MDEVKTYVNVKFQNTGPQSPSNDGLTSTYSELNFPKDEPLIVENEDPPTASRPGELPITAQTDGLTSTYAVLNFRKGEPHIDQDEDPPIASGPAVMPRTAQAGAHEHESKLKMENRPYRQICPLCLVTSAFIVIVIGLSIHGEWNGFQVKSDRMHTNLNHRFTELETKFRSVNETKGQICELLTSRREQPCSKDWIRNKDRCYYVSTVDTSSLRAMQECSNSDSRLLEINSRDEANFVSRKLVDGDRSYWIGKCENWNVALAILYKVSSVTSDCKDCYSYPASYPCNRDRRFICEKSALLLPEIPERIQNLCQQPVETT